MDTEELGYTTFDPAGQTHSLQNGANGIGGHGGLGGLANGPLGIDEPVLFFDQDVDEDENAMDIDEIDSDSEGPPDPSAPPDWSKIKRVRPETEEEAIQLNATMTKVYDEMQEYLESIPKAPQPPDLICPLMSHQQQAVWWMSEQENKGSLRAGILADDMGVGKTLETLGLLCAKRVANTLIVCPMTMVNHWKTEIERHVLPNTFKVIVYYGANRPKDLATLKAANIVITTYGTVTAEYKKLLSHGLTEETLAQGRPFAPDLRQNLPVGKPLLLYCVPWVRVVLDEAQCIKNRFGMGSKACRALPGTYRWALSGTPISNSLDDLFSLILFLKWPDYTDAKDWNKWIKRPVADNQADGYKMLAALVRRCMLRRRKNQKLNGRAIVELPPVTSNSINLDFPEEDKLFYMATEQRIMDQFDILANKGQAYVMRNYTHVLVLLLRLRQAACHPYLVAMAYEDEAVVRNRAWNFDALEEWTKGLVRTLQTARKDVIDQEEVSATMTDQELMKKVSERVSMNFVTNGAGALCQRCGLTADDPMITPCKHIFCVKCIPDSQFGICPHCKAPYGNTTGNGIRPAKPHELRDAIDAPSSPSSLRRNASEMPSMKSKVGIIKRDPAVASRNGLKLEMPSSTRPHFKPVPEVICLDSDEEFEEILMLKTPFDSPMGRAVTAPATSLPGHRTSFPEAPKHSVMKAAPSLYTPKHDPGASTPPNGASTIQPASRTFKPDPASRTRMVVMTSSPPLMDTNNIVMSRARLKDDKFQPMIGGLKKGPTPAPNPSSVTLPSRKSSNSQLSSSQYHETAPAHDIHDMNGDDDNAGDISSTTEATPPTGSSSSREYDSGEATTLPLASTAKIDPEATTKSVSNASSNLSRHSSSFSTGMTILIDSDDDDADEQRERAQQLQMERQRAMERRIVQEAENQAIPAEVLEESLHPSRQQKAQLLTEDEETTLALAEASAAAQEDQELPGLSAQKTTDLSNRVLPLDIPLPPLPSSRNGRKGRGGDVDDLEGEDSERSEDDEDDADDLDGFVVDDDEDVYEGYEPKTKSKPKREATTEPEAASKRRKTAEENDEDFLIDEDAPKVKTEDSNGERGDDQATKKRGRPGSGKPKKPKLTAAEKMRPQEFVQNFGKIVVDEGTTDAKLPHTFRLAGKDGLKQARAMDLKRHSSKLSALLGALELVKNAGNDDKIVIYSQFTRYMDIIAVPLRDWGWKTARLDGTMDQKQRTAVLHSFDHDPTVRILIISLKAGGVGINLTIANHIFLMDPWWNTAVENQAIDRVHRIGQKKPIFVTRFVVNNTVEARIVDIQAQKDKVTDRALANRRTDAPPKPGLTFAQLRQLFTSSFTTRPALNMDTTHALPMFNPRENVGARRAREGPDEFAFQRQVQAMNRSEADVAPSNGHGLAPTVTNDEEKGEEFDPYRPL
jgi:SNF2 family DNA or RNA helicase